MRSYVYICWYISSYIDISKPLNWLALTIAIASYVFYFHCILILNVQIVYTDVAMGYKEQNSTDCNVQKSWK